jgi:hypothetical protein
MKINPLLIFIFLVFISKPIDAQQLELQWSKTSGGSGWDWVNSMQTDHQGNYYIAGGLAGTFVDDTLVSKPDENSHSFIAKYDSSGKILWQNSFGGKCFSNVSSLALSGDFIFVCGTFQDSLEFARTKIKSNSFTNAYLACLSTDGTPIWIKVVSDRSQIASLSLSATPMGRLYMAGSYSDTLVLSKQIFASSGKQSIFLTEVNSQGDFLDPLSFTGGQFVSQPVLACNEQMLCLGGSFADSLQLNDTTLYAAASNDFYLASLKLDGKIRWSISGGGSGNDKVTGLILLKSGDIALLGNFEQTILLGKKIYSSAGYSDIFLSCIDSLGKTKWATTAGGVADDYGHYLTEGPKGNIYVAGSFRRGILMDFGKDKQKSEEYKNESGFGNAFIAKYNKNGELKSSTYLPGTCEDYCKSLLVDKYGTVIASGNFFNTLELSGHAGGYRTTHEAIGDKDIFIARFSDRCLKFSVNLGNDTAICIGTPIVIKVRNKFDAYLWANDGSTGKSIVADKPGIYAVTVIDMYGCQASDSLLVTLNKIPIVFAGNDTIMQADQEVKLSGAVVSESESIHWSTLGSGIFADPSILYPVYSPSARDISAGEVKLVLSAENKCVIVSDTLKLRLVFGDKDIIVYPNPTESEVYISSKSEGMTSLSLTDSHGTLIMHKSLKENKAFLLNLEAYPVGSYLIKITTKSQIKTLSITKVYH